MTKRKSPPVATWNLPDLLDAALTAFEAGGIAAVITYSFGSTRVPRGLYRCPGCEGKGGVTDPGDCADCDGGGCLEVGGNGCITTFELVYVDQPQGPRGPDPKPSYRRLTYPGTDTTMPQEGPTRRSHDYPTLAAGPCTPEGSDDEP